MQKLLSRSPTPAFLLCHSPKPPLFSKIPRKMPPQSSSSFALSGGVGPNPSSSSSLAATISKKASCHVSARVFTTVAETRSVGGGSCRICRCNVQTGSSMGKGSRAWVAFKDERPVRGGRPAWVHTGGSGVVEDAEAVVDREGVVSKDEVGRVLRRQKEASPKLDLLAIPGVGPRNLRKLVDKGIAGVAELKQLYRDKVQP